MSINNIKDYDNIINDILSNKRIKESQKIKIKKLIENALNDKKIQTDSIDYIINIGEYLNEN